MARGDVHIIGPRGGSYCGEGGYPTTRRPCQECLWAKETHETPPRDATTPTRDVDDADIHVPHMSEAKVVVSMTSVPSRNGTLDPTLQSLRTQTRPPDEIRLYLGPGCERVQWTKKGPPLYCIPTVDRGPVTKLSAAADPYVRADAVIVTVDDDIVFAPQWLETLLGYADRHPDDAVGMAGWNADELLTTGRYERASGPCDVIEGFSGVAYRKWFFDRDVMHPPNSLKYVDDVWISGYLHRLGIVRRVVPGQERLVDTTRSSNQEGIHTRADFDSLNKEGARMCFPNYKKIGAARRRKLKAESQ
jgi:hypothetical protein